MANPSKSITISVLQLFGVMTILVSVISFLFYALIGAKDAANALALADRDRAISRLEAQQKAYEEMADEAVRSALEIANAYRIRDGQAPIIPRADVVPESHSPPSDMQRTAAALATLRALMVDIREAEGMKPRVESK